MELENVITLGNNDITLDFSELFKSEKKDPTGKIIEPLQQQEEYKSTPKPQNLPEAQKTAKNQERAEENHAESNSRSQEVYKAYQDNIKASSQLQTEILKGIKAGESVYDLFLKAARAISLMTHNSLFYSEAEAELIAIYGAGLLEKDPLRKELQDTQTRLERLLKAEEREQDADNLNRIQGAIKAHRARIAELESLIA